MIELHPTHCTCEDCRSRRTIRNADSAADGYRADELEDFGFLLAGDDADREDD